MNIRWAVLTFGVAAFIVNGAASLAAQDAHEVRVGTMVNITTCVMPSLDEDDEFVLTNIVDVPAHPPYAGQVVYWVNDWKKLRSFVGKRVQFDAQIKDVDRKEIEVKAAHHNGNGGNGNGNGNGAIVEIELNGNEVKTTPDTVGLAAAAYRSDDDDDEIAIPSTLVKLKLRNTPTLVSGSCDAAAMRTAAVSAGSLELDTRLDTETRSAASIETERSAAVTETETARIDTPAAAVEVETPAAAVDIAAAAETPAVADVAEVEVETPAPAATETAAASMTRTELPATATPLASLLLLGLGSLSGAAALRIRRK